MYDNVPARAREKEVHVTKDQPTTPRYAAGTEARKIEKGGKRMPGGVMSPEAAQALQILVERGYASSMLKAIERALIGAAARYKRPAE